MRYPNTSKAGRHKRAVRPETRLVLPPATEGQDDSVLKSLIDAWLVPRLVDEFVRERALDLSRGRAEPSKEHEDGETPRAA